MFLKQVQISKDKIMLRFFKQVQTVFSVCFRLHYAYKHKELEMNETNNKEKLNKTELQ